MKITTAPILPNNLAIRNNREYYRNIKKNSDKITFSKIRFSSEPNTVRLNSVKIEDLDRKNKEAIRLFIHNLKNYGVCPIRHSLNPELVNKVQIEGIRLLSEPRELLLPFGKLNKPGMPKGYYSKVYTTYKGEPVLKRDVDNPFTPNPKTAWQLGESDNIFPEGYENLGQNAELLFKEMKTTGDILTGAIAEYYSDKKGYLKKLANVNESNPFHLMQLMYYPGFSSDSLPPYPTKDTFIRHYEHTDGSLFSMALPSTQKGIEYRDKKGNWNYYELKPDELLVHTGEILELLTKDYSKDQIKAIPHRVAGTKEILSEPRYNVNFFYIPDKRKPLFSLRTRKPIEIIKFPNLNNTFYFRDLGLITRINNYFTKRLYARLNVPTMMQPLSRLSIQTRDQTPISFKLNHVEKYFQLRNRVNFEKNKVESLTAKKERLSL